MKTKLIIITGKAQSGKDTSSMFIKNYIKYLGKSCEIYPFAHELKKICENLFGLTHEQCWGSNQHKDTKTKFRWSDLPIDSKKMASLMLRDSRPSSSDFLSAREIMQIWGTDIFRRFDEDCWVRSAINRIKSDDMDFAVISDARFKNEIEFALQYDPVVIRLTRNLLDQNHESETALDHYDFKKIKNHYIIDNSNMSMEEKNDLLSEIVKEIAL